MNAIQRCLVLCGMSVVAALAGCAGLTVSQAEHDFGKVLIGATSPPLQVNWSNKTTSDIEIVGWQLAVAPFTTVTPQDGIVAPNTATGDATITFAPTTTGRFESAVRPGTLPSSSSRVRIKGEGVAYLRQGTGMRTPGVSVRTAPLDFGRKLINTPPPAEVTFTITNSTASAMNLTAVVTGGAPVFGVQNANIVVPASDASTTPPTPGSVTVTLTFAPTAVGEQLGAVEFTGTNLRLGVSIKGTGVGGEGD